MKNLLKSFRNKNESEKELRKKGFGLSQNSDSNNSLNIKDSDIENSDTESEIFDYNLQELFQENILLNMATIDEMRDLFRTFARNQYGNDLGNDLGTANPNLVNNALENINATRGLVVEFPLFGGSENEDAGEWIQRFTDAYTTNALANDNVNRFRIAKGCLVGTARDWLRTEGANIDNWGGGNNDTSLDRRVVSKYTSDEIKERWQDELENIKQGDRESVTGYVTRFRTNLNEAITAARNQETGIKAVAARFSGKEIVEEKNIEEIMKEETNKYKKENEIYQKMQKPVNEKDINDMSKMLEQFKAEILNGIERNQPRGNVNRNTNTRNARIIRCFECNKEGHIRPECPQLRQGNNYRTQNNFNRDNNNERRNNNNRNINLMDYERYNNNNRYNDNEYYNNYNNYEKEMYPTLRSGRTYGDLSSKTRDQSPYNRDINNDYNEMEIEDVPIPPKREYDMKMDIDVLEELRKANMMLKLKKCEWAKKNVEYLGHIVGTDGLKLDDKKIEKIKNLKPPRNIKQIREINGLCSYYRKFVKGYSKIVKPIMELTRKNVPFVWADKQQKALKEIKEKLINYPILQHPNFEKEFILITDASGEGLGAILEQLDENNREIVISYASRSLINAEKNYPITELECLAVFWGIKYFHKYLFGRKFKVITDHAALKGFMSTSKVPKGKRGRWMMELQQYDFEIIHRPGKENKNADAMSRLI
ncbi:unnamed protein product [Rhizophagus irregularis]|nr:unnamed protein product [Rhizophagus irregularis]